MTEALANGRWVEVDAEVGDRDDPQTVPTLCILNEGFDGLRILFWLDPVEQLLYLIGDLPEDYQERYWGCDGEPGRGFHFHGTLTRDDVR